MERNNTPREGGAQLPTAGPRQMANPVGNQLAFIPRTTILHVFVYECTIEPNHYDCRSVPTLIPFMSLVLAPWDGLFQGNTRELSLLTLVFHPN